MRLTEQALPTWGCSLPSGFFQPLESSGSVRSDFIYFSCSKPTLGVGKSRCFLEPVQDPGLGLALGDPSVLPWVSRAQLCSGKHLQQRLGLPGAALCLPFPQDIPSLHPSRGGNGIASGDITALAAPSEPSSTGNGTGMHWGGSGLGDASSLPGLLSWIPAN